MSGLSDSSLSKQMPIAAPPEAEHNPAERVLGQHLLGHHRHKPIMALRTKVRPNGDLQQSNLFREVSPLGTPAWQKLPDEVRTLLTSLLAGLLLEPRACTLHRPVGEGQQ